MIDQAKIDAALAELSDLRARVGAAQFMSRAAESLCRRLGLHFVGLYLVENLSIVFNSGSGGLGKFFLSSKHQFQLTDTSLVSRAIATGELWAIETRYEDPYWMYRIYRSPLPVRVRRNTKLLLHLVEEIQNNWTLPGDPLHPTPPGWELYLPVRAGKQVLGALQIHAWDLSEAVRQKAPWSSYLLDLAETEEPAPITADDILALQRLADRLSTLIK